MITRFVAVPAGYAPAKTEFGVFRRVALPPSSDRFRAQVGLGTLLNDVPQFTPVLAVFLFAQRFLVTGMLAGATKN